MKKADRGSRWLLVIALLAGFGFESALAALPQLKLERVGRTFSRPLYVTTIPGDSSRLFVVEQTVGRIRVLNPATQTIQSNAFLTVTGLTTGGEQGLLGLAFHPQYLSNGFFYVNYTTTMGGAAGHTEITRYKVVGDPATATTADPASKTVLLTYNQPEANHNGGWIAFGPDGYLYISSGDGGGADDRHGTIGNGQNLTTLLGKILRIDVNGDDFPASTTQNYAIPPTNPFVGQTGADEIWAFGLRNPWRCAFDRLTGDLWIGDVGQGAREEIDINPAGVGGLNFGWRPREGFIQNPNYDGSPYAMENPVTTATNPVHDYGRTFGVSVTGGYVYRGSKIPGLQGTYFFADYGSARFWALVRQNGTNTVTEITSQVNPSTPSPRPVGNVSSFGEDADGEIYVCDYQDGEIYRLIAAAAPAPRLSGAAVANNQFQFNFNPAVGSSYTVEYRESLASGGWLTLTNLPSATSTQAVTVLDAVGPAQRFYRVRTP